MSGPEQKRGGRVFMAQDKTGWTTERILAWLLIGVTLIVAVAGLILGIVALVRSSDVASDAGVSSVAAISALSASDAAVVLDQAVGGSSGSGPSLTFSMQLVQLAVNGSVVPGAAPIVVALQFTNGNSAKTQVAIPALSFTLGQSGFLWTKDTFIPYPFRSATANYATFQLGTTGVYANFFRDGTMRVTGANGVALGAGKYTTPSITSNYFLTANTTVSPPANYPISQYISDFVTGLTNDNSHESFAGNYYEYFAFDYLSGVAHLVTMENGYPESSSPAFYQQASSSLYPTTGTIRNGLAAYYRVGNNGQVLKGPTLLTPTPINDSICAIEGGFCNTQQEAGVAVNRLNSKLVNAVYLDSSGTPLKFGGVAGLYSTNNGNTWAFQSPAATMPMLVYDPLEVPDVYDNTIYEGGDNRLTPDGAGVAWTSGLLCTDRTASVAGFECFGYTGNTPDGGQTYYGVDIFRGINYNTVSLDYPVTAAGSDGKGGQQYCVSYKQDASVIELDFFGQSFPVAMYCYHTPAGKPGQVDMVQHLEIPGSEPWHYGGAYIHTDGRIFIVGHSAPNEQLPPPDHPEWNFGVGPGQYGVFATGNAPIWLTICTPMPNVTCSTPKIIARTDMGDVVVSLQPVRGTWSHPSVAVDKNGVIYVNYVTFMSTNPSADGYNPTTSSDELLLIASSDNGGTWTVPRRVNNDTYSASCKINPVMKYDPVTHSLGFAWIDSRVDTTGTGTQSKHFTAFISL